MHTYTSKNSNPDVTRQFPTTPNPNMSDWGYGVFGVSNGSSGISYSLSTSWMMLVLLTLSLTAFFRQLISKWNYYKGGSEFRKEISKIRGPRPLPVLGNALSLFVPDYEVLDVFKRWAKEYGSVFRIWLGSTAYIFVADPMIAEKILSSKVHINKPNEYGLLRSFLGNGLVTLNGHDWTSRRKIVNSKFFNFKTIEDFMSAFNDQSFKLVTTLAKLEAVPGRVFNIHPYMTQCTLNIICEAAMGRIDSDMNDEMYMMTVHEMCEVLIQRTLRPWLRPELIWKLSTQGRKEKKLKRILNEFISKVIHQRKCERQKSEDTQNTESPKCKSYLDLLLDLNEKGNCFTNEDVRDETQTFIFGGHDTTASSLSWTLFLIATYPDVQAILGAELFEIFGHNRERHVTLQDTRRMKYLDCCIKESLRLFPSGPFFGRLLHENLYLEDGHIFPSGSTVFIAPFLLHRDPKFYPEPNAFKPERFLAENSGDRTAFEYLPFSAGPRSCIGQKFVMVEEKVVIANILRNFHLEPAQKLEEIRCILELTLKPKFGPLLKIKPKK